MVNMMIENNETKQKTTTMNTLIVNTQSWLKNTKINNSISIGISFITWGCQIENKEKKMFKIKFKNVFKCPLGLNKTFFCIQNHSSIFIKRNLIISDRIFFSKVINQWIKSYEWMNDRNI